MNSIERAVRVGSAGAEVCAVMSGLVVRPCYRADSYEVAWWTTRLIEMQTPAEALCMWLLVPLCAEHVENSTVEQVLVAVLREILNLLNARARTSAKSENFIVEIALTLVANVLHPDLVVHTYPGDPSMRSEPRLWCTPTTNSSTGKSPTMQLVEGSFLPVFRVVFQTWAFASCADLGFALCFPSPDPC